MSELTSVKMPKQVRDRFATAAEARGVTVRVLLDELSRRAVDEALMSRARGDLARLRDTDPDGWRDYVGEGESWEAGTVDRIA